MAHWIEGNSMSSFMKKWNSILLAFTNSLVVANNPDPSNPFNLTLAYVFGTVSHLYHLYIIQLYLCFHYYSPFYSLNCPCASRFNCFVHPLFLALNSVSSQVRQRMQDGEEVGTRLGYLEEVVVVEPEILNKICPLWVCQIVRIRNKAMYQCHVIKTRVRSHIQK